MKTMDDYRQSIENWVDKLESGEASAAQVRAHAAEMRAVIAMARFELEYHMQHGVKPEFDYVKLKPAA